MALSDSLQPKEIHSETSLIGSAHSHWVGFGVPSIHITRTSITTVISITSSSSSIPTMVTTLKGRLSNTRTAKPGSGLLPNLAGNRVHRLQQEKSCQQKLNKVIRVPAWQAVQNRHRKTPSVRSFRAPATRVVRTEPKLKTCCRSTAGCLRGAKVGPVGPGPIWLWIWAYGSNPVLGHVYRVNKKLRITWRLRLSHLA